MSLINVHNEWDPLEEMIVGVPDNAQVPTPGPDLFALEYHEHHDSPEQIPSGAYDEQIIEETKEDLAVLVSTLESLGVKVRRPEVSDHAQSFSSPEWSSNGEFNYVLWAPEMVDTGTTWPYARASIWSGMNFFMVNPTLAVVNEAQQPLIRLLESRGIEAALVPLRHCRTLSGGLHCVTLDVRRRGVLEDYS